MPQLQQELALLESFPFVFFFQGRWIRLRVMLAEGPRVWREFADSQGLGGGVERAHAAMLRRRSCRGYKLDSWASAFFGETHAVPSMPRGFKDLESADGIKPMRHFHLVVVPDSRWCHRFAYASTHPGDLFHGCATSAT
jgi:hypothetical protein